MDAPNLSFNINGRLVNPEALEGLPEEVRARVTSPEFRAHVRAELKRLHATGRRESRLRPVEFIAVPRGRDFHLQSQKLERPAGMSGRQWRNTRKAVRRIGGGI